MSPQRETAPAWWHAEGPDDCVVCRHRFHVELGYHCADCDGPVCPACATTVRERQVIVCSECRDGAAD